MYKTDLLNKINKSSCAYKSTDGLNLSELEDELNWFYPLMSDLNAKNILCEAMKHQYMDAADFNSQNIKKIEEAPTGMGKSGVIHYTCIKWFLYKAEKKENAIFHLVNPLNVLNDQTTFELVFVIKHFIKMFGPKYGFDSSDFAILFNRCNTNDASDCLINKRWEDGQIFADSFKKFDLYKKTKKFIVVVSCKPSVPNIAGKWDKNSCCTVIDEVHSLKCSNNEADLEENENNSDNTKIWAAINNYSEYIRGITATTTQDLVDNEFNLYTVITSGDKDYKPNLHIIEFEEGLKSGRIVMPHAIYKGWVNSFSLTELMEDQKKYAIKCNLNIDIHKILYTASDNEDIAKQIIENDYVGIFYISTCYFGKIKGRKNKDGSIEILNKNFTVKQFSDAIENETEHCYIFHIKQLIAGVNVKGLTGCILQQIQPESNYINTKQTIGRCLRKKGHKNGGIVTFLIEDKDNGMSEINDREKIISLMTKMYGANWSYKNFCGTKKPRKGNPKPPAPSKEGFEDKPEIKLTWFLKFKEEYDNYKELLEQAKLIGDDSIIEQMQTMINELKYKTAMKHSSIGHQKECVSMIDQFLVNSYWEAEV